jgi:hypothetical protein
VLIKLNKVCGSCLFHWELIGLTSLDFIKEFFGINTKTILGASPCVELEQVKGAQKAMMSENFEHPFNMPYTPDLVTLFSFLSPLLAPYYPLKRFLQRRRVMTL